MLGKGSNWKVEKKDYVCSLHFLGGRKLGGNKIPTIFCQTTRESSDEAPILDKYKENEENVQTSIESEENDDAENENQNPLDHHLFSDDLLDSTESTENTPKPSFAIMARKEIIIERENNEHVSAVERPLQARQKFMRVEDYKDDDSAIKLYINLPDYATFIALYNFAKPKDGYSLNYHNNEEDNKRASEQKNKKGRPRVLSEANELFLTLCRLRLHLLEEDLKHRFGISLSTVSEIFLTGLIVFIIA